jgi:hypothetical protein
VPGVARTDNERLVVTPEPMTVALNPELLARGRDALLAVPYESQPLELVLAEDFDASVRARRERARRGQDGTASTAGTGLLPAVEQQLARVVVGGGIAGAPAIVVDAHEFRGTPTDAGTMRWVHLLEHEGWHVRLTERGEHGDPLL